MKVFDATEDFLNSMNTRNVYNTDEEDYNCGGYALNTYSWYMPYACETEDEEEKICLSIMSGGTKEEIYEDLLEEYINYMLNDFTNLRVLSNPTEIKNNERLIYFRIFYETWFCDEEDEEKGIPSVHFDFHYRYFDNGHWWEKCGAEELSICDDKMEEVWICGPNKYDSRTIYLALQMEE